MNKSILNKRNILKAVLVFFALIGILLSLHLLVNSIDLLSFIRSMHGG
jgi:hypothetical protein